METGDTTTIEQPLLGLDRSEVARVTVGTAPTDDGEDGTTRVTLTVEPDDPETAVARSAGERLAAVETSLRAGETTFTHYLDAPVTAECAEVALEEGETTVLRATLREAVAPPDGEESVLLENDGDRFTRPNARGPPRPPSEAPSFDGYGADAGPASGVVRAVRERLFWFGADRRVDVDEERLVLRADWPDACTVTASVRVERNALLVYVLGESVGDEATVAVGEGSVTRERRADRFDEVVRSVEPPFPITAEGATARVADGDLRVEVPRCDPSGRTDGRIDVSVESED